MRDELSETVTRASEALEASVQAADWPAVEPIEDRRFAVIERLLADRAVGARVLDLSDDEAGDARAFEEIGAERVTHVASLAELEGLRRGEGFDIVHYRAEGRLALDSDAVPVLQRLARLLTDGGTVVLTSLAWTSERCAHSSRTTWSDGRLEWLHGAQVLRWMLETAGLTVLDHIDDAGLVTDRPETTRIAWLACQLPGGL